MEENIVENGVIVEVNRILVSEMGKWVQRRIEKLPEVARYPAYNAVRNLVWAGGIATLEPSRYQDGERGFRVPAAFLAMHAMEEAVTAVVLSAKKAGYGRLAKSVNVRDHYHKTTLAWLFGQVVEMVQESKPAIAYSGEADEIILQTDEGGKKYHQVAMLGLLGWRDEQGSPLTSLTGMLLKRHGGEEKLAEIVKSNGSARNSLMYATKDGFLTGPPDLASDLEGLTKTVLAVLWAAIDITDKTGERAQIVEIALRTTAELKKLAFPPPAKDQCPLGKDCAISAEYSPDGKFY
ncbi:hypothetical protein [Pseudooceanicola sp.]|uniref:hypothetical protein n=1 Tax=Pseudooceanicola sp. TaxID=1914328 RepID=UPI00351615A4